MIIDRETFTEIAVHLKCTSDALLVAAQAVSVIVNHVPPEVANEESAKAVDGMRNICLRINMIEETLRAVLEANTEESKVAVPS